MKSIPAEVEYLIVGAGPTGLGAAHRLQEIGIQNFLLLEHDTVVGGLAKSFTDAAGFTWDIGGHVHFSSFEYYNNLLDNLVPDSNWNQHQRKSWVYFDNQLVPFPLQRNIHFLSAQNQKSCLDGLKTRPSPILHSKTFAEWGLQNFGVGLYSIFLEPYNKKVWGYSLEKLNSSWVENRVAPVSVIEIEENLKQNKMDVDWGPNSTFRYPDGGTGNIWKALGKKIEPSQLSLDCSLLHVDPVLKTALTSKGEIKYSFLVNTTPMTSFLDRMSHVPLEIKQMRSLFLHSSTLAIGLGFTSPIPENIKTCSWIYFPQDRFPFFRATLLSGYGKGMTPSVDCWSLLLEVSCLPENRPTVQDLIQQCIQVLKQDSFFAISEAPVSTWSYYAHHGYPTPFLERDQILPAIQNFLNHHNIFSRGRFGGWKYEVSNQDHSLMQGKEIIDRLALGKSEMIYRT